ncbi:Lsr2 family protein [Streptomyces sp. NPDC058469]|uniref:histone-like nucleoid-structuring protein Lsr2 n=1 Tax=Streptomyces sp. NPDC058469 TaxID=3346514 RepID=UPI0036512ED0
MARKVVQIDDLDPEQEAERTLTFGWNGDYREIDLSTENIKKFADAMAPFFKASRPIDPKTGQRRFANGSNGQGVLSYGDFEPSEVRAWAADNGVEVSDKGRIPQDIVNQWQSAMKKKAEEEAAAKAAPAPATPPPPAKAGATSK